MRATVGPGAAPHGLGEEFLSHTQWLDGQEAVSAVQCSAVHSSGVLYSAVQCRTVMGSGLHCNIMQCSGM